MAVGLDEVLQRVPVTHEGRTIDATLLACRHAKLCAEIRIGACIALQKLLALRPTIRLCGQRIQSPRRRRRRRRGRGRQRRGRRRTLLGPSLVLAVLVPMALQINPSALQRLGVADAVRGTHVVVAPRVARHLAHLAGWGSRGRRVDVGTPLIHSIALSGTAGVARRRLDKGAGALARAQVPERACSVGGGLGGGDGHGGGDGGLGGRSHPRV
eukprot:scaffold97024_cov26-Tisochrysis_lutea.AAC.3